MTAQLILATVLLTLTTSSPDVRPLNENPKAYWVPEAWRTKATDLLQPGPDGLRGGLMLRDVTLGHRVTVTYRGDGGQLIVALVPKKVAPADVLWLGERSALVLESSDVSPGVQKRAVAHLKELLEKRETGWGWLRQDPNADEKRQAAAQARQQAVRAYQLAARGEAVKAMKQASDAAQAAPKDIVTLHRAARAAYLAKRPSRAESMGRSTIPRARRAAKAEGLVGLDQARAQRLLATSLALAGDAKGALKATRALIDGEFPCEAVSVARELWFTEAFVQAEQLALAITDKDVTCDGAWALRVDLLRTTKRFDAARKLARGALEMRSGLTRLRSALARAEGDVREEEEALKQAISAVERGRSKADSVITLASLVSHLGEHRAPLDKWEGDAIRDPSPRTLGLATVTYFVRGQHEQTLKMVSDLRAQLPNASGLLGLEALSLIALKRLDDARTLLTGAWSTLQTDLWAGAAEASLLEAEGKSADAIAAWHLYREQRRRLPGPLTLGEAKQRLIALGVVFEEQGDDLKPAAVKTDAVAESSGERSWVWILGGLFIGALLMFVVGRAGRREAP